MTADVDVAVVGLGAMGSMTLWRLAERGVDCVGLDRHHPPHTLGSSHGESRIIRTAYVEGAFYVPLVQHAFHLWRELERWSEAPLLTVTGALMIGPRGGGVVGGALASARAHHLEHALLTGADAAERHPQHVLGPDDAVLWEPAAGVLRPERGIETALARAHALGAAVRPGTPVAAVSTGEGAVAVHLEDGSTIRARRAVVAAGAWTGTLLPPLASCLQVERQVLTWFRARDPDAFAPERFPVFIRELPDGRLRYGIPSLDAATVKLAVHHEGAAAEPDRLAREVTAADLAPAEELAATALRGLVPVAVRAEVCMYTNTPDEHLLVGAVPGAPGVVVVGGCSGHSFKFAPVLGDAAADLVSAGATRYEVTALDPARAALRG